MGPCTGDLGFASRANEGVRPYKCELGCAFAGQPKAAVPT